MTETTRKTQEEELNQAVDLFKHVSKFLLRYIWERGECPVIFG